MTANGRSGIRHRQRRRSKATRLSDLMQRISRLPRAKRMRAVTRIEDALAEMGAA